MQTRPDCNTTHTTASISVHNSKMPEVTAANKQDKILNSARKLYSDGKFKAALAAFKEVKLTSAHSTDL